MSTSPTCGAICTAQDLGIFQDARDSGSETFANALTTAVAVGIGIFSGGSATPLMVLVYSAVGAAANVVPRIILSGGTYPLDSLGADMLTGAVTVGTAPFVVYRAADPLTRWQAVIRGATEGAVNGGVLGFAQGAIDTVARDATWDQGLHIGLLRVGQAGSVSALIGAPIGGVVGAIRRIPPRLPPDVPRPAGTVIHMVEQDGLSYIKYQPGDVASADSVLATVSQRLEAAETIAYNAQRRMAAEGYVFSQADDALVTWLKNQGCGHIATAMDEAAATGTARAVTPQTSRGSMGFSRDIMYARNLDASAIHPITGSKTTAQSQIVQQMTEAGSGSRAILRYDRAGSPGHMLYVENIQCQIWLFDPIQALAVPLNGPHQSGADAFLRVFDIRPGEVHYRASAAIRECNGIDLIVTYRTTVG